MTSKRLGIPHVSNPSTLQDSAVHLAERALALARAQFGVTDTIFAYVADRLGDYYARLGRRAEAMALWDPYEDHGGLSDERVRSARILLWKGHCSVHNRFTPDMVDRRREQIPGVKVIVHPECRFEVAQRADAIGSTEGIIKTVRDSPPGTRWAVGTELNLVSRLARESAPEREVVSLDDCFCVCSTMFRIDPAAPAVGAGEPARGPRRQPRAGAPAGGGRGAGRARPHAGHPLGARAFTAAYSPGG